MNEVLHLYIALKSHGGGQGGRGTYKIQDTDTIDPGFASQVPCVVRLRQQKHFGKG